MLYKGTRKNNGILPIQRYPTAKAVLSSPKRVPVALYCIVLIVIVIVIVIVMVNLAQLAAILCSCVLGHVS